MVQDRSGGCEVSVIVRSFGRLPYLAELLERLLAQDHDSFEVVIVEQTAQASDDDVVRLAPLFGDPRVQVLRRPPLGGPAARNEGVRAARGEIVLLIDDDDLPVGADWIRSHALAYRDPNLVALSARHVRRQGETCPYPTSLRPVIRRLCMRYTPLKTPFGYARFDEDVDGVDWIYGTNASLRRSLAMRAGLWDTTVRAHDEHSFAFRLPRVLRRGEYLAFRAYPPILRRLHVPGGLGKRHATAKRNLLENLRFQQHVIARYFPLRFRVAYPLYLASALHTTLDWIWLGGWGGRSVGERLLQSADVVAGLGEAARRVREEAVNGLPP